MKTERSMNGLLWGLSIAAVGLLGVWVAGACTSTGLTDDQAKTVRAYEAEQLLCVDQARTLQESKDCRCTVKAKYGRPCDLPTTDGGAL